MSKINILQLRQKVCLYIHALVLLRCLPSLDVKYNFFVTKKRKRSGQPSLGRTDYNGIKILWSLHRSWSFSSEPSPQLSTLSQTLHLGIHLKFWQRKRWAGGQGTSSQTLTVSSEPSPQSLSPSQRHSRGTQIWRNIFICHCEFIYHMRPNIFVAFDISQIPPIIICIKTYLIFKIDNRIKILKGYWFWCIRYLPDPDNNYMYKNLFYLLFKLTIEL